MSEIVVRKPQPEEASRIADLHQLTWEETYHDKLPAVAWGPGAHKRRTQMWQQITSDPQEGHRYAVLDVDGRLSGFAGAGPAREADAPRDYQLWFVYLLQAEQGTGAGQALFDEVVGDRPCYLWVLDDNPRARRFYERNGFVADGARQPVGFEGSTAEVIRMVR